ncbi:hypothetical protein K440DRAFT_645224 [Wilcoxina mikolae CBS 423.85]|nr:hypothetical protein K440DRAFT_645224 [Wilcoxina mikolae CBS 423.85]
MFSGRWQQGRSPLELHQDDSAAMKIILDITITNRLTFRRTSYWKSSRHRKIPTDRAKNDIVVKGPLPLLNMKNTGEATPAAGAEEEGITSSSRRSQSKEGPTLLAKDLEVLEIHKTTFRYCSIILLTPKTKYPHGFMGLFDLTEEHIMIQETCRIVMSRHGLIQYYENGTPVAFKDLNQILTAYAYRELEAIYPILMKAKGNWLRVSKWYLRSSAPAQNSATAPKSGKASCETQEDCLLNDLRLSDHPKYAFDPDPPCEESRSA